MRYLCTLLLILLIGTVYSRPLDDDNQVQEGDDKRDKISKAPDASVTESSSGEKPTADVGSETKSSENTDKKAAVGSTVAPVTAVTKAKTTQKVTIGSTAKPTTAVAGKVSTAGPTTAAPGVTTTAKTTAAVKTTKASITSTNAPTEAKTVEKSDNNTNTMKGTTFHAAVRFLDEKFTDDLQYPINPVYQSFKQHFMAMVAKIYSGYKEYKQVVVIKFSVGTKTTEPTTDDKRTTIAGDGVIVDFYLRFFTPGTHLKVLTEAITSGKLGTHPVSPLFVRAYVAEPKGRVCTPDCKIKCYSYCDEGCCHLHVVQNVELPGPSPVDAFIEQQNEQLCQGASCPPQVQPVQQPCQGAACPPPMTVQAPCQGPSCAPMPMPQMPCQGPACAPPAMPQMPCQAAACPPPAMPQTPCQSPSCAPPPVQQAPCQGPACAPPPRSPCQGPSCAPPQAPCAGPACPPSMPPITMFAPPPCQGPACPPAMPQMPQMPMPQMPCQGLSCAPSMPMANPCRGPSCSPPPMMMMQPPPFTNYAMMPPPQCPPSCSQVCAPSCPNQCCGGGMPQLPMMLPPPARCGPRGC